jgi:hypothetical protein
MYETVLISSSVSPSSRLNAALREAIALPTPKHSTRLVLALLCTLRFGRMPRRSRILAGLQARISTFLVRPILAPNFTCQSALVTCTPRRGCARADDRVGADCGVGRGGAVQAVCLLELVLSLSL